MGFSSRIGQSRANSLLIKSVVVLSIAKYWAAKPQMTQYVVSPMRRQHFVNGRLKPVVRQDERAWRVCFDRAALPHGLRGVEEPRHVRHQQPREVCCVVDPP